MKTSATTVLEKSLFKGIEWPYFDRRSIITYMTVYLFEFGKPQMKSMTISSIYVLELVVDVTILQEV